MVTYLGTLLNTTILDVTVYNTYTPLPTNDCYSGIEFLDLNFCCGCLKSLWMYTRWHMIYSGMTLKANPENITRYLVQHVVSYVWCDFEVLMTRNGSSQYFLWANKGLLCLEDGSKLIINHCWSDTSSRSKLLDSSKFLCASKFHKEVLVTSSLVLGSSEFWFQKQILLVGLEQIPGAIKPHHSTTRWTTQISPWTSPWWWRCNSLGVWQQTECSPLAPMSWLLSVKWLVTHLHYFVFNVCLLPTIISLLKEGKEPNVISFFFFWSFFPHPKILSACAREHSLFIPGRGLARIGGVSW